jgi:hypothetical protein
MQSQRLGQLLHLADAGVRRPLAPFCEKASHRLAAALFPQQTQGFLEQISDIERLVGFERLLQTRQLVGPDVLWFLDIFSGMRWRIGRYNGSKR